ncbi:MAG: DedA family protein, partial [Trueperaceae bacterium]
PFAGFLVAADRLNGPLVLLATAVGGFVGTTAFYWLGRQLGDAKVRAFIGRYGRYVLLQISDYDQALKFFQKHDVKVVFWGRFVPGIRSLISLPAGVARMPFGPFALYTLLGTALWSSALLLAGYLLGARWELVLDVVDRFELVLWAVVFALLAAWVVWRLRARARHRAS